MKESKAPKKLYYAPYGDIREDYPITDNDIEYIRKDAFIEKACVWLNYFYNEDTHSYLIDEDIRKFKNYMKGE